MPKKKDKKVEFKKPNVFDLRDQMEWAKEELVDLVYRNKDKPEQDKLILDALKTYGGIVLKQQVELHASIGPELRAPFGFLKMSPPEPRLEDAPEAPALPEPPEAPSHPETNTPEEDHVDNYSNSVTVRPTTTGARDGEAEK